MHETVPDHLARYAGVLDDFDAFAASLSRPLPQSVAVNSLRIHPDRLPELVGKALTLTPIPWCPGAYRLAAEDRPGRLWPFTAGLYLVQEEASLLPAMLLEAQPGHRVLDLCAAPGNKTAHLALAMGNRGTLIANDLKMQRLQALHDVCRRLGLANISVTGHDGAVYPVADAQFDRILLDAPCTSEGKARRGYLRASSDAFRSFICGQQRALLRRALALCRPGGRIVYSTCTFAPEENEAIISDVIEAADGQLRALPAPFAVPGASPSLKTFQGREFHPDVAHGIRLWPHRADTGGFFAILLERTDLAAERTPPIECQALPDPAPAELIDGLLERFAMAPEMLAGLHCFATQNTLRLVAADHAPPAGVQLEAIGLEVARLRHGRARLSTGGAMALGQLAARNTIELDGDALQCWRRREAIILDVSRVASCYPGLVLVRHAGLVQGTGLLRLEADGLARLESQFPKAWATNPLPAAAAP